MIKFEKLDFKKESVFCISDTHGHHSNMTRGTSTWTDKSNCRNFDTIEDMTQTIVDGINNKVGKEDLLIHTGDFSFGGIENMFKFRNAIHCKNIILLRGNHDQRIDESNKHLFTQFIDIGYFQVENMSLFCCHYPVMHWHSQNRGVYMIHGHLHGDEDDFIKKYHKEYRIMDVGVDNYFKQNEKYEPYSILEIEKLLKHKSIAQRH